MNEAQEKIESYKRDLLSQALEKLTVEEKRIFNLMYPKFPRADQMAWAIQQCYNTIKKHAENV